MKIALIADVHGNLPALEAVLADAALQGVAAVWHAGDAVGYGPFPDQVVRRLGEVCTKNILGNYDRKVLDFPKRKATWRRTKAPEKYLAFRWTHETLSREGRRALRALPESRRFRQGNSRILLTHGSPASAEEHLGPDTPVTRLAALAALARADVVCCGHSHQVFARRAGGVRFVNPGSVGRPEGGDWRAAYAMLTFDRVGISVRFRRVAYPITETLDALRTLGLPAAFARMLRQGRALSDLRPAPAPGRAVLPPPGARPKDRAALAAVQAFALRCRYEADHTHQVTRLALDLFDALRPVHALGLADRYLLQCGAMLHDIGWSAGGKAHHRAAQRLIQRATHLPFTPRERMLVGLLARYHRKELPVPDDPGYADLSSANRRRVRILAGILRVADGLDRSHAALVQGLVCRISPRRIRIDCRTAGPAAAEAAAAMLKGTLFEQAFARGLIIRMSGAGPARRRGA
jgi:putative phosphoesterase